MAKDVEATKNAAVSPAELHKGSGLAVDNGKSRWYIAECKATKERTIRTMLTKADFEVFVASRIEEKVYKSRNRYQKETIVIPGKVFVHTRETELMRIMLGYPSVYRFMLNRTTKDRIYAYVPDHEMQQLQYILGNAENPVHITAASLKVDQPVKVMRGALAGVEGWYYKEGHTTYIVIRVTMGTNHFVYTEVPLEDIQPL